MRQATRVASASGSRALSTAASQEPGGLWTILEGQLDAIRVRNWAEHSNKHCHPLCQPGPSNRHPSLLTWRVPVCACVRAGEGNMEERAHHRHPTGSMHRWAGRAVNVSAHDAHKNPKPQGGVHIAVSFASSLFYILFEIAATAITD